MRPGDFWIAVDAWQKERERRDRLMCELARGLAARVVNPFLQKPIDDVTKFWQMGYDAEKNPTLKMTEEEKQESIKRLVQILDGDGKGI
jgi:hypothetical protein